MFDIDVDLGAEVGAVFLVHVRRRGRGLTVVAGFMARRYGWVHVQRREGRKRGKENVRRMCCPAEMEGCPTLYDFVAKSMRVRIVVDEEVGEEG